MEFQPAMDPVTAAQNVAEDYKGGARQLALDIGKSPSTFDHQLNERAGSQLGLRTAVKMTRRTKDLRILLAFAAECGQMCVPLPEALDLEGQDCMKKLSEASREFAELCQEVCASLSDGQINDNEMGRINRGAGELISAIHSLQRAAAEKHRGDKPLRSVA
jgi:hypothetical protein